MKNIRKIIPLLIIIATFSFESIAQDAWVNDGYRNGIEHTFERNNLLYSIGWHDNADKEKLKHVDFYLYTTNKQGAVIDSIFLPLPDFFAADSLTVLRPNTQEFEHNPVEVEDTICFGIYAQKPNQRVNHIPFLAYYINGEIVKCVRKDHVDGQEINALGPQTKLGNGKFARVYYKIHAYMDYTTHIAIEDFNGENSKIVKTYRGIPKSWIHMIRELIPDNQHPDAFFIHELQYHLTGVSERQRDYIVRLRDNGGQYWKRMVTHDFDQRADLVPMGQLDNGDIVALWHNDRFGDDQKIYLSKRKHSDGSLLQEKAYNGSLLFDTLNVIPNTFQKMTMMGNNRFMVFNKRDLKLPNSDGSIIELRTIGCFYFNEDLNLVAFRNLLPFPENTFANTGRLGNNNLINTVFFDTDEKLVISGTHQSLTTQEGGIFQTGFLLRTDADLCLTAGCDSIDAFLESLHTHRTPDAAQVEIKVFPNPNNGSFQIQLHHSIQANQPPVQLQVYDQKGRQFYDERWPLGQTNRQLELPDLQPGLYHILLNDGNQILGTHRIIIH